ncbi:MAG: site-specific DNA-methyltransferase, partial [Conexivisphaerales archaeon]
MTKDLILAGDVYSCLDILKDNSITVAITSPPYWKQRDYGFEGQIGQENTPEAYIGRLISIFNKLKEKLKENGIFFLNIGDKYLSRYGNSHLLLIPYRLAYHMTKHGWYLEDIIIWYKPNHMPSSVKDRFANTYEPVLVFSKNKSNIYKKDMGSVVRVPLQQTKWKHTAFFPENLVKELLLRVNLSDGDIVIDPFAGTGTVADVVKKMYNKRLTSIMIEKNNDYIEIIKQRTKIDNIRQINTEKQYQWEEVKEENIFTKEKNSELFIDTKETVFIAESEDHFLSILKEINSERDDAVFFIGLKHWTIKSIYYTHSVFYNGYVIRNMIVNSNGKDWYPVFMIVKDSKKV